MELPRPPVTVTDPRSRGPLVPVEEPPPARLSRRGAALLAAAAVVGASALFAADVVRDRRDAVEQRRLDGVVDVALAGRGVPWTSSHDPVTGTGTVRGLVRLVNRGPRDVRVVSARLGDLRAAGTTLRAHDGEAVLVLQDEVRCPSGGGRPPREPEARELHVALETPAGPRQVVLADGGLPRGSLDDSVQRACAYPPLAERVQLGGEVRRVQGRTAVLHVDVANAGRRPLRLLSLVPSRGLVVLSVDGEQDRLPVVLPARTRRFPDVQTLEVRLGLVCGALVGADLLRPFEELSLIVEEDDFSQMTSVGALVRDPDRQLRQLAARTCSPG